MLNPEPVAEPWLKPIWIAVTALFTAFVGFMSARPRLQSARLQKEFQEESKRIHAALAERITKLEHEQLRSEFHKALGDLKGMIRQADQKLTDHDTNERRIWDEIHQIRDWLRPGPT